MSFVDTGNPRPLPWRLRGPLVLAGDVQPGDQAAPLDWPTTDPDESVTIELNLSLNEYVALASAVDVGRDIAFPEDSESIWYVWNRAISPVIQAVQQVIERVAVGGIVYIEKEPEMGNIHYKNVNGSDELWIDCGCGVWKRFGLTEIPDGDLAGAGSVGPGANGGGFAPNVPLLTGGNAGCYRETAAEIYMGQIADWAANILGVISNGLDFFTAADEFVEFSASVVDLVVAGDNYSSLDGLTANQVRNALLGESSTIAPSIPTGELARADLFAINQALPAFSGLVPVGYLADRWATFGNVRLLNSRLAIAQAECATGSSGALPPPLYQSYESLDGLYTVWNVTGGIGPQQVGTFSTLVAPDGIDWGQVVGYRTEKVYISGTNPTEGSFVLGACGATPSSSNQASGWYQAGVAGVKDAIDESGFAGDGSQTFVFNGGSYGLVPGSCIEAGSGGAGVPIGDRIYQYTPLVIVTLN